jgi:cold shock CspA family protein
MVTGMVVNYDEKRGYGFIAPSGGGEDVFVHANEVTGRGLRITAGMQVEFSILDTNRGYKAYDVRAIEEPGVPAATQPAAGFEVTAGAPTSVGTVDAELVRQNDEDDMLDVLSEQEFVAQVTELLLATGTGLTGATILELRKALTQYAHKNGWIE